MKSKLVYASLILAIGFISCENNSQAVNSTTSADTAVLVNDPANSLNANPVNDTMVKDTVRNH